jgi:hypothetical protein
MKRVSQKVTLSFFEVVYNYIRMLKRRGMPPPSKTSGLVT